MDTDDDPSLTELLQRFSETRDREIAEAILEEVFPRLRDIAAEQLRSEHRANGVSPTELVNETWEKYFHKGKWKIQDREHFFAIAAKVMGHLLVDLARRRLAFKRGAGELAVELDDAFVDHRHNAANLERIVEIGRLMDELEKIDPGLHEVVALHYWLGYTLQEITEMEGSSMKKVRYRLEKGLGWMMQRMKG